MDRTCVVALCALAAWSCGGTPEGVNPVDAGAADAPAMKDAIADAPGSPTDADADAGHTLLPLPPVTCPPAPTPFLMAQNLPRALGWELAIDDAALYVPVDQRIARFPKCGGPREELTDDEPNPGGILLSGSTVYWLDIVLGGSVRSISTLGGTPTTIAKAGGMGEPHSLRLFGGDLFYVVNAGLPSGAFSVPAKGGTPFYIGAADDTGALDATNAYVHVRANNKWVTASMPRKGGVATYLADSENSSSIQIDDTTVYFTARGIGPAYVRSVPKTGGAWKDLATNQGITTYLVVDDTHVYWINEGANIMRVLKGGGTPEVFVPNVGATGLGLDAKSVYFATWGGGQNNSKLWRVDK
jgi:hypothetical protein